MSEEGGVPPSWQTPLTFRLDRVTRPAEAKCRCGTPLAHGEARIEVRADSTILQGFFEGVPFCSLACVRAFALERVERLDAGGPADVCAELRELLDDLEEVRTSLERQYPVDS